MGLNKKAMFFTILSILLLSLFLLSYTSYSLIQNQRESINKRVTTINNFVFSLEKDLPRQLYISGYRAMFLFEKTIAETGVYISNINSSFNEIFFNGTLSSVEQSLMQGATYPDMVDLLNQRANKINVNVSFSSPQIFITQDSPWEIKVTLISNIFITDLGNLASWNKTQTSVSYIPIQSFDDPIYTINTNSKVINKINKTPYTSFNIANLTSHLENSYYIASPLAPSLLDKLEGKTSANENGIESLVYLPKLSAQGITIQDKSAVDYIYFSSNNPSASQVTGMPSWFKLDSPHLSVYGVS